MISKLTIVALILAFGLSAASAHAPDNSPPASPEVAAAIQPYLLVQDDGRHLHYSRQDREGALPKRARLCRCRDAETDQRRECFLDRVDDQNVRWRVDHDAGGRR
jgi:hypothetical protein